MPKPDDNEGVRGGVCDVCELPMLMCERRPECLGVRGFKQGDRVVYRDRVDGDPQEGSVTSVGNEFVFVCYGLPGSTSQATRPEDLEHVP